ncbi:MAG: hypothetical protein GIX03_11005 [Candidatus Eremiobacteraeota bacterium]|nr:hypothetical protein [Candidatus Eremiobacteraeota bacterium]MBC5824866.1 hypothetical protein [Candidatus Eremiobacteraeota bacterium]
MPLQLELVPLLQTQRQIYDIPLGMERFKRYLRTMLGEDGALRFPLPLMNPMGKAHVAAKLDELLAISAEGVAHRALHEAASRLSDHDGALRVALVLADDAGGWTNRWFSDAQHRFEPKYFVRHGWAVVAAWTSEAIDADRVYTETLAAVQRTVSQRERGLPTTLGAMLAQEREALSFAGIAARYDRRERERIGGTIAPVIHRGDFAAVIPAFYGDEAAVACGYAPLGIPPFGGFESLLPSPT